MTAGSRAYTTSYSENLVVGNLAFSVFQIKFAGITINLSWITTMSYTSSKTGEISKIDPQRNCRSMSHVVLSSGNLTNDRYISLNHKTLSSLLTVTFISRAPPYNRRLGLVSAVHAVICGKKQKSWWPFKWNLFAGIFSHRNVFLVFYKMTSFLVN